MNGLRKFTPLGTTVVVGLAIALAGCQTTEHLLAPTDQRIIDRFESETTPILTEYSALAARLPIAEQLYQIPRLGAQAPGTGGHFEITLTPSYASGLIELDQRDLGELDTLVARLKGRDGLRLEVIGHASSSLPAALIVIIRRCPSSVRKRSRLICKKGWRWIRRPCASMVAATANR